MVNSYRYGFVFMLLIFVMLLAGCNPENTRNTEIIQYRTIEVASLDKSLLRACETTEPPTVETYLKLNRDAKEDAMTSYVMLLLKHNQRCSINSLSVKSQYEKQISNVEAFNQAERSRVEKLYREKTGKELTNVK